MQFMVIEHFRDQDAKAVYARFREKGRLMPDGIAFVASWVTADLGRCFQVMECDDVTLLQRWVAEWADLVEFEILPVTAEHNPYSTVVKMDNVPTTAPVSAEARAEAEAATRPANTAVPLEAPPRKPALEQP